MKKLTTALLAAAALTTAVSAEGGSNTGFYLGASAGVANTNVKYNFVSVNPAATGSTQNYNSTSGKMAGLFGVFAGYGMVVGQGAYVGGEVYGGFDTTKVTPYDDSATTAPNGYHKTTVKRSSFYGLAARVGYMITPSTLAYIRLGVEAGKWTMQVVPNQASAAYANNYTTAPTSAQIAQESATVTKSKNSINFAPGLGFETYINKNLFVRAEYSYLFGPSISAVQDVSLFKASYANGTSLNHTAKISQHAFKIGVGYKF